MEASHYIAPVPEDINRKTAHAVEQTSAQVHEGIDKAASAVRPVLDDLASGAHVAADNVAGVATRAADIFGAKAGQLKAVQSQAMERCREYVRTHPGTSLATAAAGGFLLSYLLSWKTR